ncbi:MAG TPA: thioredoxin domain-containing protein, partial [Actinomycetota bacterium]|nr:thioredoxin domain-containing protein [Actinomycetota bacterium]
PDEIPKASSDDVPLLVDFWAEWCAPCRAITPVLAQLSDEWSGRMRFRKLNVDDFDGVWERFGFRGIPTMIVFRNGEEVHRVTGFGGKDALVKELEPLLS